MTLTSLVIRRELAEKIKNLGVRQDSVFWWIQPDELVDEWIIARWTSHSRPTIAAFTSGELGEMLPAILDKDDIRYYLKSAIRGDGDFRLYDLYFKADWLHGDQNAFALDMTNKSEADGRAQMLIYLLKEGIVTVMEINKRMEERGL